MPLYFPWVGCLGGAVWLCLYGLNKCLFIQGEGSSITESPELGSSCPGLLLTLSGSWTSWVVTSIITHLIVEHTCSYMLRGGTGPGHPGESPEGGLLKGCTITGSFSKWNPGAWGELGVVGRAVLECAGGRLLGGPRRWRCFWKTGGFYLAGTDQDA